MGGLLDGYPGPAGGVPMIEQGVDEVEEAPDADGFGEVGVGACAEKPVDPYLAGICADDDDGCVACGWVGLDAVEQFFAGHVGQVQVEQDQVGMVVGGEVERDS